jgi:hypothetical protein
LEPLLFALTKHKFALAEIILNTMTLKDRTQQILFESVLKQVINDKNMKAIEIMLNHGDVKSNFYLAQKYKLLINSRNFINNCYNRGTSVASNARTLFGCKQATYNVTTSDEESDSLENLFKRRK